MKILFICNEYPPNKHGGIGVFVKNLANNLKNNGFECVIIGIYPILEPTDEIIDNIRVIRITELKSPSGGKWKELKEIN